MSDSDFPGEIRTKLRSSVVEKRDALVLSLRECGFVVRAAEDLSTVLFRAPDAKRMRCYTHAFCQFGYRNAIVTHCVVGDRDSERREYFRVSVDDPKFVLYAKEVATVFGAALKLLDTVFDTYVDSNAVILSSITENCRMRDELKALVTSEKQFVVCEAIDPTGRMSVAQTITMSLNANAVVYSGGRVLMCMTDRPGMAATQMKIDRIDLMRMRAYFTETLKAVGVLDYNVEFVLDYDFAESKKRFARTNVVARNCTEYVLDDRTGEMRLVRAGSSRGWSSGYDFDDYAEEMHRACGWHLQTTKRTTPANEEVDAYQLRLDQMCVYIPEWGDVVKVGTRKMIVLPYRVPLGLKHGACESVVVPPPATSAIEIATETAAETTTETTTEIAAGTTIRIAAGTTAGTTVVTTTTTSSARETVRLDDVSVPDDDVYMEDSPDEIRRKMREANCTNDSRNNPVFEYIKYVLLRWYHRVDLCGRVYCNVEEIEAAWAGMDKCVLREDVARMIIRIVEIVGAHFASSRELTKLKESVTLCVASHSV